MNNTDAKSQNISLIPRIDCVVDIFSGLTTVTGSAYPFTFTGKQNRL